MDKVDLNKYIERNCPNLWNYLTASPSGYLTQEILGSISPRSAAGRINDLIAQEPDELQRALENPEARRLFLITAAGSRFLTSILSRQPQLISRVFLEREVNLRKNRSQKEEDLRSQLPALNRPADFDKMLRVYKEQEFLRIGVRDLAEIADERETMIELSDLAAACIQIAIEYHFSLLTARHGNPQDSAETGFAVIAMGKLSGLELNFSSDIDLIYLRAPEEGYTQGPDKITAAGFYEALARAVSKSLSQVTEDGFVFRVDLRLRPEGDKGELVPSVNNALDYYMGWGRTWERAALMKAVPIAGDTKVGAEFIKELEPFIYRKYLDYSTLEEMRTMKVQIETQLKKKPGINIKLGQGGIREIEFFVQALQLINAGRTPRVRSASTLEGLDLLRQTNIIEKSTADQLKEAYLFFRKTEHRIQINHQLQTHELPKSPEDQEELARRMGYKNGALASFLADLEKHRKIVEELFSSMFYHVNDGPEDKLSPQTRKIIDNIEDESIAQGLLEESGFTDPVNSRRILKSLLVPDSRQPLSDKAKRLLERLAPLFLEELVKAPEPDRALVALAAYLESLHSHSAYFSTLLENPPTIGFIAKILGESRFFTDLLIRHPQSIDSLIAKGAQSYSKDKNTLASELDERLAYTEDFEDELDVLRRFKNEEMLVIGVHHLTGEIDSPTARRRMSDLAEVCLQGAVDIALREMRKKYGYSEVFDSLPFVVLGMGKFGGAEMSYLSDLDVIFIYSPPEEYIGKFSSHEWFSRFAGRILSILSLPTAEGVAWAIDTRLRPSGNKGPLVSSIDSFREYHNTSSQLWEKQALIKARPITGPERLTDAVDGIISDCIRNTTITETERSEIDRLRKRMESEIAMEDTQHVDVKTGHGGLIDVEFLTQALILTHADKHPEVMVKNTLKSLTALRDAGLLNEEWFEALDAGYRFLTNLEDRLRIMENKSIDRMPLSGDKFRALAKRLGYDSGAEDQLAEEYISVTNSIRSIYNAVFRAGSVKELIHQPPKSPLTEGL